MVKLVCSLLTNDIFCLLNKQGSRPTKLEKADILELTVSHVQKLHGEQQQQQQHRQVPEQPSDETSKFKAGFSECARVVRDLLLSQRSLAPTGLEQRLSQHLDVYLNRFDGRNGRSPSPSSSCSSFESKESPESYRRQLLSNSPLLDDSWTNETTSSHVIELSHSQQSFSNLSSSSSKMILLDARPVWRPWWTITPAIHKLSFMYIDTSV